MKDENTNKTWRDVHAKWVDSGRIGTCNCWGCSRDVDLLLAQGSRGGSSALPVIVALVAAIVVYHYGYKLERHLERHQLVTVTQSLGGNVIGTERMTLEQADNVLNRISRGISPEWAMDKDTNYWEGSGK